MGDSKAGRVIFIGNIPYGLTEEQIVHTFSTVGHVVNFRLVYDSDTGRPKGFGFCEFADTDSAASAVRNLNGYEIMGRELRVDFSHVGGKDADTQSSNTNQQPPIQSAPPPQPPPPNGFPAQPGALPPLPRGVDLPAGLTAPDAISKTLSTLNPAQILDILSQMKGLVMGDPTRATELFKQAPQLAYAIFQALLLMGLVDTSVLASVVEAGNQPQQQSSTPAPSTQQVSPGGLPPRPGTGQAYPPQQPYPPTNYPPQQQQQQQGYPPPAAAAAVPGGASQDDLLKQVMAMTQQQIDQLPPMERYQIMTLRASMGAA